MLRRGKRRKQSCTRLASAMTGYKCWEIELKKGYDVNMFREDLKELFELAGVGGRRVHPASHMAQTSGSST